MADVLSGIVPPVLPDRFHVRRIENGSAYFAGRDSAGHPALLVKATDNGPSVPVRLAGLDVRYGVPCEVVEDDEARVENLSAIVLLSEQTGAESYFAMLMDSLVETLGARPTGQQIGAAVQQLVDLFQRLRPPPRKPLVGLVGEVFFVQAARDPAAAVFAWRADPTDRFDFAIGGLRLEIKAASSRTRVHSLSYEQANPPPGTNGLIASVWIEAAGGGMSLFELLSATERRLGASHSAVAKLRTIVADTLGNSLLPALEWRFDTALAWSSLQLYAADSVPAIRDALPPGVGGVRFNSDMSAAQPLQVSRLASRFPADEAAILPRSTA